MSADGEVARPAATSDDELRVPSVTTQTADSVPDETEPESLARGARVVDPGRYEVIGEHGRGGLGVVTRVHDRELGRDVAVKELLSRGVVSERRFAREARITARLEHPGIVPVYEAGRWPDGTPFYAMKLVSGRPLRELIAERKTVDERIGLLHHVIAVADAMAYAHGRNVIHRDLKPANIIVGEFGETVVIDWGLAKDLSDGTTIGAGPDGDGDGELTKAGSVLGTPAYMAPEQERGEAVDQRADVFAIGAMLWELCSLHKVPPVDRRQRHRLLRRAGIDDDLLAILDRSIDRDPARRYADAGALAADLKAFKAGARIATRSYSLLALLAHWTRRHRALAAASGALAVLAIASVVALVVLYRASTRNAEVAQARLLQSYTERGRRALLDGNYDDALIFLSEAIRGGDRSPGTRFALERAAQPRLADRAVVSTTDERTWIASFSPDGRRIVVTDGNHARVLDASTRRVLLTVEHPAEISAAAYNREGTRLATGDREGAVRVWDASTGVSLRAFHLGRTDGATPSLSVIAFSPDESFIAANSALEVSVWNTAGERVAELRHERGEYAEAMSISADGRWLAVASHDGADVYDTRTWTLAKKISVPGLIALDLDPSAARLATASVRGEAAVWSIPTGERLQQLFATGEPLRVIRFSPDGSLVACGGKRGSSGLWSTRTGELISTLAGHRDTISAISFDATSSRVVTASSDSTIVVFDTKLGLPLSVLAGPRGAMLDVVVARGSDAVLVVGWDGSAHVLDGTPSYREWSVPGVGRDCGFDSLTQPDGRFQVVDCRALGAWIWDTTEHHLLARLQASVLRNPGQVASPVVTADGSRVAVAVGSSVRVYRLPGGELDHELVHRGAVTALAFASTGHALASGDEHGGIQREADDGSIAELGPLPAAVEALAVFPDGRLVSVDAERHLRVHDARRGTVSRELATNARTRVMRLTRDGRRLITIPRNGDLTPPVLWDIEAGRFITLLGVPTVATFAAQFVHVDREIVTGANDGVVRLWDASTGRLLRSYFGGGTNVLDATMSPDGTRIVAGFSDGTVGFWDTESGALLWRMQASNAMISGLRFDGDDLVTRSSTGELARWRFPKLASLAAIEPILACLARRFDAETGGTIDQPPCARDRGEQSVAP